MKKAFCLSTKVLVSAVFLTTLVGCDALGLTPKKEVKKDVKKDVVKPVQTNVEPQAAVALGKDEIARVGSWVLTTSEFEERLKLLKQGLPDFDEKDGNAKQLVLDELIRQQLLVKDAEESDIADSKEIKDAVDDFRKTLLVQELANRLTKDVVATDEDAQKYYDENKELFVEPIKWKVREIVLADEAAAKAALVQLLQGADFAQIATAQSKGKTAAEGGLLKEFTKAPFEAMQTAVSTLDAGGVSAVFKGPEGFYIVKVDSKSGGATKALADVKKDLIAGLTMRKQQSAVIEHLNKLAEKNKVEVNKELVGSWVAKEKADTKSDKK